MLRNAQVPISPNANPLPEVPLRCETETFQSISLSSLERLAAERKYPDRLALPKNGRILFVATKDIDWIEAEGNYVCLHVGNREHEFRETLTELEEKLSPADFLRIHRSTIVNIRRIKEIQPWFHGHHRVLLQDGTDLRMSRYQHEIARKLGLT